MMERKRERKGEKTEEKGENGGRKAIGRQELGMAESKGSIGRGGEEKGEERLGNV